MSRGFSLVEITVVLAIIGLIVGMVVGGRELAEGAKLRAAITQIDELENAITTFYEKFSYFPGDYPDASSYWAACVVDPSRASNTCDGDGDWLVEEGVTVNEDIRVFQHLALANLVDRDYTGLYTGASDKYKAGASIMESQFDGGALWFRTQSTSTFGTDGAQIEIGAPRTVSSITNAYWDEGLITPADARSVDEKIDDGLATGGRVYANRGESVGDDSVCVSAKWDQASANYTLSDTTQSCRLHVWYDQRK